MTPSSSPPPLSTLLRARAWASTVLLSAGVLLAGSAWAQQDAGSPPPTAVTGNKAPAARQPTPAKPPPAPKAPVAGKQAAAKPPASVHTTPVVRQPPAKPLTDWEKATALAKKHAYDQACPLFEKATHTTADSAALWNDLGQCEWHRGHRKQAMDAAQRAIVLGDRAQRKTAYETLRAVAGHVDLPTKGCEWLPEMPGTCDEQLWACAYPWEQQISPQHSLSGHALTFGITNEERDVLEQALRDNTALREQLAMEWKALTTEGVDEKVCTACHAQATDSADGLVNARAAQCFQQKTGRAPDANICVQSDADCDAYTGCLDDASAAAHRAETARASWPEAFEVISAAHKVCDATCGVVTKTTCEVVGLDACRGFVGYACVKTGRGKRPQVTIGEIAVDDATSNWSEVEELPAHVPPAHVPPAPVNHGGATSPGDLGAQAARHSR